VRQEGFDDNQEHKCGVIRGALEATNHDYEISKAIAVKKWDEVRSKML
jgi:hypothetical protein